VRGRYFSQDLMVTQPSFILETSWPCQAKSEKYVVEESGMSTQEQSFPVREELKALRASHQVVLLNEEQEGTGMDRLPGGVYGFSHSPTQWDGPLFRTKKYLDFEVHKLTDGTSFLIGYASRDDAQKADDRGAAELTLHPDSEEGTHTLISIPLYRVRHGQHVSMLRRGKPLHIELEPIE
jgi:hypothetical protein